MDSFEHMAIKELDLTACHQNTIADRINAVPGLKTSTGKQPRFIPIDIPSQFCCVGKNKQCSFL